MPTVKADVVAGLVQDTVDGGDAALREALTVALRSPSKKAAKKATTKKATTKKATTKTATTKKPTPKKATTKKATTKKATTTQKTPATPKKKKAPSTTTK